MAKFVFSICFLDLMCLLFFSLFMHIMSNYLFSIKKYFEHLILYLGETAREISHWFRLVKTNPILFHRRIGHVYGIHHGRGLPVPERVPRVQWTFGYHPTYRSMLHNSCSGPPHVDGGVTCRSSWNWKNRYNHKSETRNLIVDVFAVFQNSLFFLVSSEDFSEILVSF